MESQKKSRSGMLIGIGAIVLAALLLPQVMGSGTHAANKTVATDSSIEILSAPLVEGSSSLVKKILETNIKTSTPADVNIQLTTECALWTGVATVGNAVSEAVATVKIWVTVDGVIVGFTDELPG